MADFVILPKTLRELDRVNDTDRRLKSTVCPQPVGGRDRTPRFWNADPRELEHAVKRFAQRLRNDYAGEIAADPRKFKKWVVNPVRRNFLPFAGRPAEGAITRAIELRRQGREWKDIYPVSIDNHGVLAPAMRRQAEANLRAAVRSRRNARRRRRRGKRSPVTAAPLLPA